VQRVALVDLGMGNLRSVERALARAGEEAGAPCDVMRTSDPEAVAGADKVVVPGQGAFRDCSAALAGGLGEALREQIGRGTPYFGICLGLQALFERSEEAPGAPGLGIFAGEVVRLPDGLRDPGTGEVLKIPHMGWNPVGLVGEVAGPLGVLAGDAPPYLYFVHSYHARPADPALVAAVADHGPHRITAAIARGNVTATQFHPEKSQATGLRLLGAFLSA